MRVVFLRLIATGVFAISCYQPDLVEEQPSQIFELLTTLNTYITDSIEIDQLSGGPGDANVVTGNDTDGSASAQLPAGGPGTYIDWHDLGGDIDNHRLLDLNGPSGRDPSAFPGSNECVGPANVLSKMDLTYIASANNNLFAYFAVQRSANTGDAGYYWLFTRKEPRLVAGESPCSAAEHRLLYDISGPDPSTGAQGDILIAGHFKPSATVPLLRVFRATQDTTGTTAVAAVDFTSGLWSLDPAGVAAVAVNTTVMGPGAFGAAGVKSMKGSNLDTELFAEAAVPLSVFTGSSPCGATFYGSVITRSSGAGGTSPDLKDLAGPALFNFGDAEIEAELYPICGQGAGYRLVSAKGADGSDLADPDCEWVFDDGEISTDCNGTHAFDTTGSHSGTLTVKDTVSGCEDTVTTAAVDVWAALGVAADLTAICTLDVAFGATPSGGSPAGVSYSWSFSGAGGTASPASSSAASGSFTASTGGVSYTGTVTVTDLRTDVEEPCTASASDSATPYAPIQVDIAPTAAAPTCPSMNDDGDDVTYLATVSGGNQSYSYSWSVEGCGDSATCTVNPDDGTFCAGPIAIQVTVDDTTEACASAMSEEETYSKVTTVTISNLP